ncbi:hypothetical protein, partial [Mongoliibacter sp.]
DAAELLLQNDPELTMPENAMVLRQIKSHKKHQMNWSRIS